MQSEAEAEGPVDWGPGGSAWPEGRSTALAATRARTGNSPDASRAGRDAGPSWWTHAGAAMPGREPPGPGGRVGPYRLIEPLGSGGQAVVWRAIEEGPPPRDVALKLLASPPRGAGRRRRPDPLHGEARHGARLDHPAILAATDSGIADGVSYLAMPLVDGGTLAEALASRRRRAADPAAAGPDDLWLAATAAADYPRAVARVVARVARALGCAHEARVIHRDVKPANILLDRHRPELVYLADFGLGLDLDSATPGQLRALEGTPMYMAPEKLRGRPGDGTLCDVYALGVTLYEAATEARPFRLPEGGCSPLALMAQVLAQEPPRPRAVAPWLSPELEAIIVTAMAADPARRYPGATALAEDLERYLVGRGVGVSSRRAG